MKIALFNKIVQKYELFLPLKNNLGHNIKQNM